MLKEYADERDVLITTSDGPIAGTLTVPPQATGIVIFAHGSGSSRHSARNRSVAASLQMRGFATLLFDLLTASEEKGEMAGGFLRFDIPLLAARLELVTDWVHRRSTTAAKKIGYFGASTGAGAALLASARRPGLVGAIVSRGGRPDLAGAALHEVQAPTLLIVGGADPDVIRLNEQAMAAMTCTTQLEIIPGATHLFSEPGALERVSHLAGAWFARHLGVSRLPE